MLRRRQISILATHSTDSDAMRLQNTIRWGGQFQAVTGCRDADFWRLQEGALGDPRGSALRGSEVFWSVKLRGGATQSRANCRFKGAAYASFLFPGFGDAASINLSKSRLVAGIQCLKRFYRQVHNPKLSVERLTFANTLWRLMANLQSVS